MVLTVVACIVVGGSPWASATKTSTRKDVVIIVNVRFPRMTAADYRLQMERRDQYGQWIAVSEVAPCYNVDRRCSSLVETSTQPRPAVPADRTETGARWRFSFPKIEAGLYRFVGKGYRSGGVTVTFTTKPYRVRRR